MLVLGGVGPVACRPVVLGGAPEIDKKEYDFEQAVARSRSDPPGGGECADSAGVRIRAQGPPLDDLPLGGGSICWHVQRPSCAARLATGPGRSLSRRGPHPARARALLQGVFRPFDERRARACEMDTVMGRSADPQCLLALFLPVRSNFPVSAREFVGISFDYLGGRDMAVLMSRLNSELGPSLMGLSLMAMLKASDPEAAAALMDALGIKGVAYGRLNPKVDAMNQDRGRGVCHSRPSVRTCEQAREARRSHACKPIQTRRQNRKPLLAIRTGVRRIAERPAN